MYEDNFKICNEIIAFAPIEAKLLGEGEKTVIIIDDVLTATTDVDTVKRNGKDYIYITTTRTHFMVDPDKMIMADNNSRVSEDMYRAVIQIEQRVVNEDRIADLIKELEDREETKKQKNEN